MLPLLAACYAGVVFADRLEGFGQLRHMFKTALIPQLRILPFWVRVVQGGSLAWLQRLALPASEGVSASHQQPQSACPSSSSSISVPQLPSCPTRRPRPRTFRRTAGPGAAGAGGRRGRGDPVPSLHAGGTVQRPSGCSAQPASRRYNGSRRGGGQPRIRLAACPDPNISSLCDGGRRVVW